MREIILCLAAVILAAVQTLPPVTVQVQVTPVLALGEWEVALDFAFAGASLDSEIWRRGGWVHDREQPAPVRTALWDENGAKIPVRQCDEPWFVITALLNTADGSYPGVCYRKSSFFAKVNIGLVRACDAGLGAPSGIAGRTNGIAREGGWADCEPEV